MVVALTLKAVVKLFVVAKIAEAYSVFQFITMEDVVIVVFKVLERISSLDGRSNNKKTLRKVVITVGAVVLVVITVVVVAVALVVMVLQR